MKHVHLSLILLFLLLLWPTGAGAEPILPHGTLAGELIVKFRPGITLSAAARAYGSHASPIDGLLRSSGAWAARSIGPGSNTYRVQLSAGANPRALAARLAALPEIAYAEPNHLRTLLRTPDDPVISQQWALRDIHAYEAWDVTTGGEITIALLDTGVSFSHSDLADKLLPGHDFFNNDDD